MRASLGFRAGPLYIGTGDLLHTKRRKHSGGEILVYLIIAPLLLLGLIGVVLWWAVGSAWQACRPAPAPADDPTWSAPTTRRPQA